MRKEKEIKNEILKQIFLISSGKITEIDNDSDLKIVLDSIEIIQLLAKCEEVFDYDFTYQEIDAMKSISINKLCGYFILSRVHE